MQMICHECGTEFEKPDKEIRRQVKAGRDYFFCSRSCTATYANKIRHNTPSDGLNPHQRRTKKMEDILGEKLSTAKSRLNRILIFELAKKCGLDKCFRCGELIDDLDDFTVDHKESWLLSNQASKLFYDIENIAFSHGKCNYDAGIQSSLSKNNSGVREAGSMYVY